MHARYYSGNMGRFLSLDPKVRRTSMRHSGRWNRYAYAIGNPIAFTDPDGRDIYVQVHEVAGTGKYHMSIRIEPNDQESVRGDRRFMRGNVKTKRVYATLGAGPSDGKLTSDVNRPYDVDLAIKTEEVKLDLGDRDENEVIAELFEADSNYADDLDYDIFANPDEDRSVFVADDGYNSNSYVAGVLTAAGIEVPALQSNVPGYDKPVPSAEFEKPEEE